MAARICVSLAGDVRAAIYTIVKNYEKYFIPCCVKSSQCLSWRQCLLICPTPSSFSFTAMMVRRSLQIIWMQTPWHLSPWEMPNGSSCVALMPPRGYTTKGAQRALVSAAGIVSGICRRRLRIPFGNSELSQLLRRAYNTEKGNRNNSLNGSTETALLAHAFSDAVCAEESFHWLDRNRIHHKGSCRLQVAS
ncbi:hypothetical protein C3747_68g78 [Trypanosoma cruzi]|uniref:Uncharacterized protein n=1 Tax=Trypanosoma cruzi TaxID=5693 RepID=A0A2V2WRZ8_TRYCR|nr:hypothetical protein C3747_68g78 [Trypanosoma cruzi]RNC45208.1 mitotic centromere-associated kinesin (MCAK) [Trypanosoma cruzi]